MFEQIKKIRAERQVQVSERRVAEKVGAAGMDDFVRYLHSPWRIVWSNFLAGVFRGLGFVVGATVVLAIAIYILVHILGNVPLVGEFFAKFGEFLTDIQAGAATLKSLGR
ncbi:MAG: DUF5665 domain-containing protein [Patescibacteria group bacterium]